MTGSSVVVRACGIINIHKFDQASLVAPRRVSGEETERCTGQVCSTLLGTCGSLRSSRAMPVLWACTACPSVGEGFDMHFGSSRWVKKSGLFPGMVPRTARHRTHSHAALSDVGERREVSGLFLVVSLRIGRGRSANHGAGHKVGSRLPAPRR